MDPLQKAAAVANILIGSGAVSNVYVFGSVARGYEYAKDLDMVACVTDELFRDFTGRLATLDADSKSATVALELLGIHELEVYELLGTDQHLNLLLFPTGWLGKLAEVNEALKLSGSDFALEIARDALRFLPKTGMFDVNPASGSDYNAGDGFSYTYSPEHACTAIIVDGPVDYRALTAKARELGAISAGTNYYCVDFRHIAGNSVGPELYTWDEILGTIVNIPEPARS